MYKKSIYSQLSEAFRELNKKIDNINNYNEEGLFIPDIRIGMAVGICRNCGSAVIVRQPWLSKKAIVNDGIYLFHCSNEDCHNHYGIQISPDRLGLVDFAIWDKEKVKHPKDHKSNIIYLHTRRASVPDASSSRFSGLTD